LNEIYFYVQNPLEPPLSPSLSIIGFCTTIPALQGNFDFTIWDIDLKSFSCSQVLIPRLDRSVPMVLKQTIFTIVHARAYD
jgi:hypothetical protein